MYGLDNLLQVTTSISKIILLLQPSSPKVKTSNILFVVLCFQINLLSVAFQMKAIQQYFNGNISKLKFASILSILSFN